MSKKNRPLTKAEREWYAHAARRRTRIKNRTETFVISGLKSGRGSVGVFRVDSGGPGHNDKGRKKKYVLAVSTGQGGLIRNPITELGKMITNAMDPARIPGVCKVMDAQGNVIRVLDPVTRFVLWPKS